MMKTKRIVLIVAACLFALVPCLLMVGCAADVKQRQSTRVDGVTAEGGLNNVTEAVPGRVQSGVNYPATTLASNPDAFSSTGPGSQTTLFNQSFGTAMVAGVLKAAKVRAVTQENDEITVEGLEIDNSANAAPAWAKAVEAQVIAMNQEQRAIAIEQIRAWRDGATGIAKVLADSLLAAFNPASGLGSVANAHLPPSAPIVVPAPDVGPVPPVGP
jgi:hypothetical protein